MKLIVLLLVLVSCDGCAYLHDRGRDACDMITMSLEERGVNASAQAGPLVLGAGAAGGKGFGLRSGAMGTYEFVEINTLVWGTKLLSPHEGDLDRNKGYEVSYTCIPFAHNEPDMDVREGKNFNGWQVECALMLGVGVRAGVNLAEIADFLLGWTTIDICSDDVATMDKREQEQLK
jgi:hypothetical protein